MKKTLYLIIICTIFSCNSEDYSQTTPLESNFQVKPINLFDYKSTVFSELSKAVKSYLPTLYPNCTEFSVAYKQITQEEKDLMIKCMEEHIAWYLDHHPKTDTSIFYQDFTFTDLEICGQTVDYEIEDDCSFYTGVIYHSLDLKVQFIRLFQTNREEYFDVYLNLSGPEPELMAVG